MKIPSFTVHIVYGLEASVPSKKCSPNNYKNVSIITPPLSLVLYLLYSPKKQLKGKDMSVLKSFQSFEWVCYNHNLFKA